MKFPPANTKYRYLALMGILAIPSLGLADSNSELLQRIQRLEAQLEEIRADVKTTVEHTPDEGSGKQTKSYNFSAKKTIVKMRKSRTNTNNPGSFRLGNTDITLGGFIKMDFNFSDYSDGFGATAGIGEDLFVPPTIPVGGLDGDVEFHTSAKNSRLVFGSKTKLSTGHVKTHFEIDTLASAQGNERVSNSSALRIRQAFVSWSINDKDNLLGGQSWSTFTDLKAKPETLILLGPVGSAYVRQEQLRYTRQLDQGNFQVALENPSTTLYGASNNPFDDNSVPDLILRYNSKKSNFMYSVMAMTRELKYESKTENKKARGYAVSFTGKYRWRSDDLRFSMIYGDGIGRYMGLNSYRAGYIDTKGDLELFDLMGMTIAYRHPWNNKWRSNLVLSASRSDNPDDVSAKTPSAYMSAHLNLLYQPVAKLTLGGEFLYASKELENTNQSLADDKGTLKRLQVSIKYVF